MYSTQFEELWKAYKEERGNSISEEQFAAILYTFPSVLVANADGLIDRKERNFIRHLPEMLVAAYCEDHGDEMPQISLSDSYFKEIDYLVYNIDQWKPRFLGTLHEELKNCLNERNAVFQAMWQTADSSEDISELERHTIEELSASLGL